MITGRKKEQKCWVTSQNILNNAELQKWYNYDELHAFDIKTNKNVALGRKPFKTTQNYKSDQNTMTCIDLTSKREKMISSIAKHSKLRKTTKVIKLQWIASIWRQNEQKLWVTSQNIQNNAKLQKWSKLQWLASIWRQNEQKCWVTSQNNQNNAKLQKWSTYTELHQFDVKASKNVELRLKTFKTTQTYESDQIIMNCIDLTSKRAKMMSYVAKHSKQR